jgi:hypothetical protein
LPVIDTAETDIKERMSVGLVTLVAARAGCEVSETKVDRVSRDITITPISGLPAIACTNWFDGQFQWGIGSDG